MSKRERDSEYRDLMEPVPTSVVITCLQAELSRMRTALESLFDAIKHGDAEHQAWLKEAIDAHFAGKPVPPPRNAAIAERALTAGSGNE